MAIRFAAASGLALAAALFFAAPAGAQGFFSFYEMSPRQIVGMLSDDGYELSGPMLRRGDVYVADVTSISGRSVRLIVSARDGRIIERFAAAPRWRHDDDDNVSRVARSSRFDDDEDRGSDPERRQMALGDLFNPPSRVYGNDNMFSSKPTPPAAIPDDSASKPKRHSAKKHKDTGVAKAPASSSAPATADAPKPADSSSSVAAVAPSAPPEPPKPAVEPVKPAPSEAAKPAPKTAEPKTAEPKTAEPEQAKAEGEKRATAEPAPVVRKVDAPAHKKLNDLPVGTLD